MYIAFHLKEHVSPINSSYYLKFECLDNKDIFRKERGKERGKENIFLSKDLQLAHVVFVRLSFQFIQDNVIMEDYDSIFVFLLCSTDR